MEKLTLKEKVDIVLDKCDELNSLKEELTPFMDSTYYTQLVCLSSISEVGKWADEFDRIVNIEIERWANDDNYICEHYFEYRGVRFYNLVERGCTKCILGFCQSMEKE